MQGSLDDSPIKQCSGHSNSLGQPQPRELFDQNVNDQNTRKNFRIPCRLAYQGLAGKLHCLLTHLWPFFAWVCSVLQRWPDRQSALVFPLLEGCGPRVAKAPDSAPQLSSSEDKPKSYAASPSRLTLEKGMVLFNGSSAAEKTLKCIAQDKKILQWLSEN